MPTSPALALANQRVLVQGLGRFGGGVGVTQWLVSQGARVTVTDMAKPEELTDSIAQLAGLPVTFRLGGHDTADFTSADLIVTNPAVDKRTSPYVQAALAAGIPLTTEMNLFLQRCPAFTIGITGSVGKSTTTMLIYRAVQAATAHPNANGQAPRVFLGGNIGKSLLPDLPTIRAGDIVVLEISSFMLEDTPAIAWSPNLALVTNLFPNHLDRHGTLEEYAAAKQNLLKFQQPADRAILNADHDFVAQWTHLAKGKTATFTIHTPDTLPLLMPGEHNQSNARAALAVLDALPARFAPLNRAAALQAITTFKGLSHRLELVHTSSTFPERRREGGAEPEEGQVRWYNDSKATTPEASMTALHAFPPGGAIIIVGGYDKHADMTAFEQLVARRAAGVLGIGQTGVAMVEHIRAANPIAGSRIAYVETLDRAVEQAWTWAAALQPAPAILLSTACASWGQFQNYERRGERFAQLARMHP